MISQRQKKIDDQEKTRFYIRYPKIVECHIDDTAFLVDPDTDTVFCLNPLGTGIWQLLIEPLNASEAANIVQQAFPDIPPTRIAEDITKLIDAMTKKNLVIEALTIN